MNPFKSSRQRREDQLDAIMGDSYADSMDFMPDIDGDDLAQANEAGLSLLLKIQRLAGRLLAVSLVAPVFLFVVWQIVEGW